MELSDINNFAQEYWIVITIVIIILIIISYATRKAMYKKRIKYALKAGRLEHFSGRLLGFMLLITIAFQYFNIGYILGLLIADFAIWFTYLLSHTIEKKLYPRNFRF